jgi:thiamine-phosphate pyrophosphorylase
MSGLALHGYYAIVDLKGDVPPPQPDFERRVAELVAAGPCCLQVRGKGLTAAGLALAAGWARPICRAAGVPLCVNDRVDVALAVGADVVHVGQYDLPLSEVRRIAGDRLAVGVSTHNPAQARAAAGADYIGFGPVFGTRSKDNPDPVVGLETLRDVVRESGLPVVAIGGIGLETVTMVAATGARAAAVIAAVEGAPDRTAAGRRVAAAFLIA